MSMSDLKKLCNKMYVDHSLSWDKTTLVDTFMQQLEAVSRVWSGLGTDCGAAEEATAAASPLFPPAQPPSQPPPSATGQAAAAAVAPPPPPPLPPPATGAAARRCCTCRSGGRGCQWGSNSASAATSAGFNCCCCCCCCCCCTTRRWHSGRSPSDGRRNSGCLHRCSGTPSPHLQASATPLAPGLPPSLALPTRVAVLWVGPKRRSVGWALYVLLLDGVRAPPSDGGMFICPAQTRRASLTRKPASPRGRRVGRGEAARLDSRQPASQGSPP